MSRGGVLFVFLALILADKQLSFWHCFRLINNYVLALFSSDSNCRFGIKCFLSVISLFRLNKDKIIPFSYIIELKVTKNQDIILACCFDLNLG